MAALRYHRICLLWSSERSGIRRKSVSRAICVCSMTSGAPRQPCGPWPKLKLPPGCLVMSKRSGSVKRVAVGRSDAQLYDLSLAYGVSVQLEVLGG